MRCGRCLADFLPGTRSITLAYCRLDLTKVSEEKRSIGNSLESPSSGHDRCGDSPGLRLALFGSPLYFQRHKHLSPVMNDRSRVRQYSRTCLPAIYAWSCSGWKGFQVKVRQLVFNSIITFQERAPLMNRIGIVPEELAAPYL